MDNKILLTACITHAEEQRKLRLNRRNARYASQRRIDTFKLLASCRSNRNRMETKLSRHSFQARSSAGQEQNDEIDSDDGHLIASDHDEIRQEPTEQQQAAVEDRNELTEEPTLIDDSVECSTSENDDEEENDCLIMAKLHQFTNTSVLTFCEELTSFLRRVNMNKSHSSSLLKLIKSILPVPNHLPSSIEELLTRLDIKDLFTRRSLCVLCKEELGFGQRRCSSCLSSDPKTIAAIFDVDVFLVTTTIVNRLEAEIRNYKQLIEDRDDQTQSRDIPFCRLYQELLEANRGENILSLLVHLDGISLTNSSHLKLWLFSGSIVELPPKLRSRRYNMIPMSIWIGYVEPEPSIWLKSVINQVNNLKSRGIF